MNSTDDYVDSGDYYTDSSGDYYDYADEFGYACNQFVVLTYNNIAVYLSFILGVPLHSFIIYRLLKNISKKRAYHYFIITQSIIDIVYLLYCPVVFNMACFLFHFILDDYVTPILQSTQLVLCVLLTVYWKTVINSQRLTDRFLYGFVFLSIIGVLNFCMNELVPTDGIGRFATDWFVLSIAGEISIAGVCIASFILVIRMDVSRFSEVTLKGQKKLATTLFYQLISLQSYYVLDLVLMFFQHYQLVLYQAEGIEAVLALLEKYGDIDTVLQEISGVWGSFLPLIRGILMFWAVKPLLQTKTIVIVTRSSSSFHSSSNKAFK